MEVEAEDDLEPTKSDEKISKDPKLDKKSEKEDLSLTLFVRNICFESTQEEFINFCQTLGEIHYATLVKRRELGGHKGTGFVKFKNRSTVDKILTYCSNHREGLPQKDFVDLELMGR